MTTEKIYHLTEPSLIAMLVPLYKRDPVTIAALCDEALDRSGRLLGKLREAARSHDSSSQERGDQ